MAAEQHEVAIEITCTNLPTEGFADRGPVYLGIQKGETLSDPEPANSKRIVFRPLLEVRKHSDGTPTFGGPFAYGPRGERFIYLVWSVQERGKPAQTFGRVKLHLNHIKWQDIQKAATRNKPIKVTLPLTNAKGKPVLASVRSDAAQWNL
jgi:hypothetical protein